jgi:anti-anti-sigma factor
MLAVNIQNLENGVLLICSGRIVAGEELNLLRSAALAHSQQREIVLDFEKVGAIDGAGLGLVALLAARMRNRGLRLHIQNPNVHVRELLELTNLDSVIEITPAHEFRQICDTLCQSANPPRGVAQP